MTSYAGNPTLKLTLLAAALLLALPRLYAQGPTDNAIAKAADEAPPSVVVLGSRSTAKTALDTAAPVGLINIKDMQTAGPLELGKLPQTLDPSFNFSSTFISDDTDIIRPATLRGLGRTICWCWSTASGANAISTSTKGLDIVAEHTTRWTGSPLVRSGQLAFNRTEVTKRNSQSPVLSGTQLFDDAQVTLIERGQPRQHHVLAADYTAGAWNVNTRANYYGEVQGQGFTAPFIQTWDAKWLVDLSLRYALTKRLSVAAGSNNLFNTLPTEWDKTKAFPFPQLGFTYCWETCPIGVNGRSVYARVDYAF
jgi:outer membrane receptor protein involved in Fe transport